MSTSSTSHTVAGGGEETEEGGRDKIDSCDVIQQSSELPTHLHGELDIFRFGKLPSKLPYLFMK